MQVQEAAAAETIIVPFFDIGLLCGGKLYPITLALGNISRLALKGLLATGAMFRCVLAHANLFYNETLMPPLTMNGIELYPRCSVNFLSVMF